VIEQWRCWQLNPYVSFSIAMCLVVGISIIFTAYLAVMFNRRAKADMLGTLTPLSELLDGTVDLEEAKATGRYRGHIAEGRAANAPDGPGKVFCTSIIDGAGGDKWSFTIRRPKGEAASLESKFDGPSDEKGARIHRFVQDRVEPFMTVPGWLRFEYDPAPGHVRVSRQMVTRRDIPNVEGFQKQLDLLVEIAAFNRDVQQPETA
jgi:hypothetical protein